MGSLKHVLEPQALGISSQMAADCSCRPMGFLGPMNLFNHMLGPMGLEWSPPKKVRDHVVESMAPGVRRTCAITL